MADISIRFFSDCLKRRVSFRMYMPDDDLRDTADMKVLFLLHGYTGDAENWVPEGLSERYDFAVVMPNGENSFWLDGLSTGHRFCTFVGEELPAYIKRTFRLTLTRENTFIMGYSMGGFGALHTALYYPQVFGKAAALSSALIVHEVAGLAEGQGNSVANYEYYRECFGEPSRVLESDNNPETLVKKILAENGDMPELYLACGTEDYLLENNREFHGFLESEGVEHIYEEDTGEHDMVFWRKYAQRFIPMMFGQQA